MLDPEFSDDPYIYLRNLIIILLLGYTYASVKSSNHQRIFLFPICGKKIKNCKNLKRAQFD